MKKILVKLFATAVLILLLPKSLPAQEIFHDPFLNWDFINFTNQTVNDFEIVVSTPNFNPNGVYTGFFPGFTTSPVDGGAHTKLAWSGRAVDPLQIAHVGAGMQGSGPILDAYWTKDGQRVDGGTIAILYEKTRVRRNPTGGPGDIDMLLQAVRGPDIPTASVQLDNIRVFSDIPATMIGLNDLNRNLNLDSLSSFERQPSVRTINNLPGDSFFDVFVGTSDNLSPAFRSLLVGDVVVNQQPIGRFWNLNPQSPEPGILGLLAVGGVLALARRR